MPVPTIFLIDNRNRISEMKDQPYDAEETPRNSLAEFPGVSAGGELNGSALLKWLLIKREAAIPGEDGGAERWSVDHLFVDNNGIPTLVEVKRSTDTRVRREVVGQMLDYPANAAQYGPVETIRQWFEQTCAEGIDPNVRLAEAVGLDDATGEAVARFWETVETNPRPKSWASKSGNTWVQTAAPWCRASSGLPGGARRPRAARRPFHGTGNRSWARCFKTRAPNGSKW